MEKETNLQTDRKRKKREEDTVKHAKVQAFMSAEEEARKLKEEHYLK